MELDNQTRFPALITRMVCGEDRIAASVLCRVTYRLAKGRLVPSEEQPWRVSPAPWKGPAGLMDGDSVLYKGGVDVFVFGRAVPERGRAASTLDVEVAVGRDFRRRVRVSGPRVWYRGLTGLTASAPRPFTSLPLTLAHAYGGKDAWTACRSRTPKTPQAWASTSPKKPPSIGPCPASRSPTAWSPAGTTARRLRASCRCP